MENRKVYAGLAILASSTLLLSACAPAGPTTDNSADASKTSGQVYTVEPTDTGLADLGDYETKPGEIRWASGDNVTSYNYLNSDNYSTYNGYAYDLMSSGFVYYGTDGTLYEEGDLGKMELVSEDPLKVKYTINKDAVWSDGTPITVNDFWLKWAAENPETVDASGATVFDPVSVDFGELIKNGPEVNGDKEFTVTYEKPYADWKIMMGGILPAHVVAKQAGLSVEELVELAKKKDGEGLKKAAEFWNSGWNYTNALPDESLIPSYGPYKLTSFSPGQSVTLTANDKYWGKHKAATETVTIRVADPSTHAQALQNGDVNAIEPQATEDTVNQLNALGDQVIVHQFSSMTYEHLDYNFKAGIFADSPELREAFALCVPRQQIVDNIIKPINPEAEILNSRGERYNFQDDYKEYVSAIYDGRYDEVDIDRAKELIEKSGVKDLTVRIGSNGNERRTNTVALIKDSCDKAGFNIQDAGSQNFFSPDGDLSSGNYDIALFAWAGSGQKTSGQNISTTNRPQNYGGYSNAEVDAAWERAASTTNEDEITAAVQDVEKQLWKDLFSLPLYAAPGVAANDAKLANVRANSTQSGLVWNLVQWSWVDKAE
ncbi:ABC transporter family substrate-binding protein [Canibacter zhoujuaniae]|uniref:ABC transporter family substrate-binding protein n=1 Tax=Canibacter zhoujuaniae TaxID=2708343 RepID=UPI00141DABBF|nr:ABC transporter family substrate-binding protein [Canibacter zhoujuaniae]